MKKLPKDPKTPKNKKKYVGGPSKDSGTGSGLPVRTLRKLKRSDAKKATSKYKTDDVLNNTGGGARASQMKRATVVKGLKNIGKK